MIRFENVLGRSPNPYVVVDPDYRIAWMNDAYLATTGRERAELVGQSMFDAFPSDPESDSFRQLKGSIDKVFETGEADELAALRYDIPQPDGTMAHRYWSASHTPVTADDGSVAYVLQHTVDITELYSLRAKRDQMNVLERAHAAEQQLHILSEEADVLRSVFEQTPGFVAMLSGPEHRFVMANAAYRKLIGNRELLNRTVAEALPEIIEQGFIDILDRVQATGEPYLGQRERVMLGSADTDELVARYLEFIFQPIRDAQGAIMGVLVQGYDITDEVEYEAQQQLLIGELNHRVKNTLAVVQGLAHQTFGKSGMDPQATERFNDRLSALASAHNVLTQNSWKEADLEQLIRDGVTIVGGAATSRVSIEGTRVELKPQTAVSFAMIVHELLTNALKYGALSNDTGRIAINWTAEKTSKGCAVSFDWIESGGPPVSAPERQGFGTRLIRHGLGGGASNKVEVQFDPAGLRCHLETIA